MNGRELSSAYFRECALPVIEAELPECARRMAAGISGGSQAHGNDDEVSRDHGWGAGFVVWLSHEDYLVHGEAMEKIVRGLPGTYRGSPAECVAMEAREFVRQMVWFADPPSRLVEWLRIPEEYLFELSPGRVLYDPSGMMAETLGAFGRYPDDVWRKRLSTRLGWMTEWGVKHLNRAQRRGDVVAAGSYWARFAEATMQAVFAVNRRYAPYHKWLYKEFTKLPELAKEVGPVLVEGFGRVAMGADLAPCVAQIEGRIGERLRAMGFAAAAEDAEAIAGYTSESYRFAVAIRRSIGDVDVRNVSLYQDVVWPPTRATTMYAVPG